MLAQFCGVRGSTPAPGAEFVRYGGHTSCVALTHDQAERPTLILDSGTGISTVTPLLGGAPFTGTILYSHLHWDHFNGLPFFAGADHEDAAARLVMPKPLETGAPGPRELLARAMSPPYFPVTPGELRGSWSFAAIEPGRHELEGFDVLAREIPHRGGRTYGYRISDGRSVLTYMPDHCPTTFGAGEDGWGVYHPAALELADGTEALIHDATLVAEEIPALACYGHAAGEYAVALAARAGARVAVLFHHAPGRTDDELDAIGARLDSAIVAAQGSVLAL
jgi:phosphoribosyl 1,2-cyclic phosphodiesterase